MFPVIPLDTVLVIVDEAELVAVPVAEDDAVVDAVVDADDVADAVTVELWDVVAVEDTDEPAVEL